MASAPAYTTDRIRNVVVPVERAKILVTMLNEPEMGAMEAGRRAGLSGQTGCAWAKRCNSGGLRALRGAPTHASARGPQRAGEPGDAEAAYARKETVCS